MKKFITSLFVLVVTMVSLLGWTFPSNEDWREKVDPKLLAKAEKNDQLDFLVVLEKQANAEAARNLKTKEEKGRHVFNLLQQTAKESQQPIIDFLKEKGAVFQSLFIVNALHVKGDLALIQSLAEMPEIASIQDNSPVLMERPIETSFTDERGPEAIEWGIDMINANDVWDMGYTGQGVVVGGQDTGYDWDHPALQKKYRGWDETTQTADHNYNWHDAIHEINLLHGDSIIAPSNNPCGLNSPIPCDDHNHGTHTMGTMIGEDGENQIGVAPGARWIACRNMERGYGSPFTYLECFQWFLAPTDLNNQNPDPSKAPHVINNSWSCPTMEGCNPANFAIMENAINFLNMAGVVVVVSAGNSGSGCSSVNAPAAMFANSFSVGATKQNDTLANFSSRGPVLVDSSGLMKPNVSAPGVGVRSSIRNGGYAFFSGTSMAGPHVVGAVALIISANPDLAGQVETIESILEQTAVPKTSAQECGGVPGTEVPNNSYGYGRIDALAAVEAALNLLTATEETSRETSFVKIYPNPFTGLVNFESKNLTGEATIELFDVNGKLIRRKVWMATSDSSIQFSLEDLPGGIYFYKIIQKEKMMQGKLVKQ